jgi:hypothetical protein
MGRGSKRKRLFWTLRIRDIDSGFWICIFVVAHWIMGTGPFTELWESE